MGLKILEFGILALLVNYHLSTCLPVRLVLCCSGIGDKDNVLDLGCGDGRVLVSLALTRGTRGTGVDISEVCFELPVFRSRKELDCRAA